MSWGTEAVASAYAHRQGIVGRLDLFAFPAWLLAVSIAFAVVVSVVAGIYPALRAARVDPIRALRSH
jgi:ABC-type lipoprotein release transport system permease subunit